MIGWVCNSTRRKAIPVGRKAIPVGRKAIPVGRKAIPVGNFCFPTGHFGKKQLLLVTLKNIIDR